MRQQATDLLRRMTIAQRAALGGTALAVVLVGFVFVQWAGKPSYVPLFNNLQPADASAVTEKLGTLKVPYQLADGGGTIMVPQGRLYRTRIDMSAAGLPSGGNPGYQILDKQGITASDFRQRIDYQRALEGELAKTINAIDGIEGTTVHLVIPKDDIFTSDQQHASASVLVRTRPGSTISTGKVQAIVHLVASSVEGLDANTVTVADASGQVLSAPGEDGQSAVLGDLHAQQTHSREDKIQASVQQMLDGALGPGKSIVTVRAELNFDDTKTTTKTFGTQPAPAVTENTTTEQFTGTGTPPAGVLGSQPAATTTNGGNSNYTKQSSQINRAVDSTEVTTQAAPGSIKRLSVAVELDSKAKATPQRVRQLVTAAAGIDPNRGDVVQVQSIQFDRTSQLQDQAALAKAHKDAQLSRMIELARNIALLLAAAFILRRVWRRTRPAEVLVEEIEIPTEMLALADGTEISAEAVIVGEDGLEYQIDETGVMGPIVRRQLREFDALPGIEDRMAAQADIAELLDRQPEDVALLLRGWMAERDAR
ncbi:MAG: flagellar M-ring protein FliF [Acidobacteria bacterium]|nr:flagellar M-ring protein FliF [Acidobacteriota bacterium]